MSGPSPTQHRAEPAADAEPARSGWEDTTADRIHTAVLDCPDVAAVSAGQFGEIGSYLPGRTVPGVKIDDERVEVHIVARYGPPLTAVAEQVGAAVAPLLAGRTLHVGVDDILLPGETLPGEDDNPQRADTAAATSPVGPTGLADSAETSPSNPPTTPPPVPDRARPGRAGGRN